MIKTNIKMRVTPEQSKKVQEICFSNGIYWAGENKDKVRIYSNYLYIRGLITHDTSNNFIYFNDAKAKEIDADFFIRTNGTCEETYLAKYTSQPKDLESALKKIENLHIALKKKVDKNKNQALEITNLLEQKKKTNELFINQSHCVLDMIAMLEHQKAKSLEAIKENERLYNYSMEQIKEIEDLKQQRANESKGYCDLKKEIDDLQEENSKLEEQLKEKDTIISYLESKLK